MDVDNATPAEAGFASKLAEKHVTSVSYSAEITASWGSEDNTSKTKSKGSAAGSLYYTVSDSGSRSEDGSLHDAVSLADSDSDFQIEVVPAAGTTKEEEVQPAAPVILFEGSGLQSTSAAAAHAHEPDEEFDYSFDNGTRQGSAYQRIFRPQPAPAHLITSLHQAHLGSLAEDSEEGSDLVSESDGGLIHDDDLPTESSPAISTSLNQPAAQTDARNSLIPGNASRAQKTAAAAAGTDGMFELDIDDDFEQAAGMSSFTAKSGQCSSLYAVASAATTQTQGDSPAVIAISQPQDSGAASGTSLETASVSADEVQLSSSQAQQAQPALQFKQAHRAQQAVSTNQQPMPDSVPLAALSPVPILGPLPEGAALQAVPAASQPKMAHSDEMARVDLEEIELGDALPTGSSAEGQPAADEWEEVNLARAREMAVDAPSAAIPGDKVRYPEALNYFLSADVKAIKKTLKKSKPAHRMASCFMRMQKSSKRLEKERTRLLCLAKMPFDDSDLMHLRLLQSVYLSFVGGPGPVGRYGPQWAALGFQGTDPTTDLRGCGILGLLHLLLLHEHDPANAQAVFKLSTAKESEFPLAPVSLNITKWTLQMVRDRKLTTAAKKQQSAVTAASDFYIGTFYTLYNHWKDKKCTMADSGFVLKEIEKRATSNAMNMVRRAGTKL